MFNTNKILKKMKGGKSILAAHLKPTGVGDNTPPQFKSHKNLMKKYCLKEFGGPNDFDFDGVPNKKDCQPRNTMRQDANLWFRGIDDMEMRLLNIQGYLEPRSDSATKPKKIWLTPNRAIAERYGKNVIAINITNMRIFPEPGRSKMFYTPDRIMKSKIHFVERGGII